jgi:tRNA pseudouridine32 synthase/23S rRNA pseudouridine746 synthase
MNPKNYFFKLENLPEGLSLPEKVDFPFFYTPHSVAQIAALEVQKELETRSFNHDFGIDKSERNGAIGKMFGVLVVRKRNGQLGYLKAFSGKLGNSNFHQGFVPPVFDILKEDGFFKKEEAVLNNLTREIEQIEKSKNYYFLKEECKRRQIEFLEKLSDFRFHLKSKKKERDEIRKKNSSLLAENEYNLLLEKLKQESISQQLEYKRLNKSLSDELIIERKELDKIEIHLTELKTIRKQKSNELQNKIFSQYTFLNQNQKTRSLLSIFKDSIFQVPPAGAGECAAPKLFQFAFSHDLEPICMAEFWWGMPPDSEVRVHKQFYPACRGKCEPILDHMLSASTVEANPLNTQSKLTDLEILYEDEWVVAINKPHDFLSVPGKILTDSILNRLKDKYPHATGPLLLHRIDMSTSGILLAAKTSEIHKILQKQFIERKIQKTYHAVLDGLIEKDTGVVDLPIILDVLDRPKQKICFEEGKKAITNFNVLMRKNGKTLIEFFPITGRTHQLRIHAAHHLGLNCPILGDDLYGRINERLYLHAFQLTFFHPIKQMDVKLISSSKFEELF